ncbi:hypothetical protein RFI_15784, partial [Reticulomyxa filosa]
KDGDHPLDEILWTPELYGVAKEYSLSTENLLTVVTKCELTTAFAQLLLSLCLSKTCNQIEHTTNTGDKSNLLDWFRLSHQYLKLHSVENDLDFRQKSLDKVLGELKQYFERDEWSEVHWQLLETMYITFMSQNTVYVLLQSQSQPQSQQQRSANECVDK